MEGNAKLMVGRDEVIKRIYDRINGQDSVSIVGYDGMGKSSMLDHIIKNFHEPNTLVVEIFNSEPQDTLDFYQFLFECLVREVEESNVIDIELKNKLKEKFFNQVNFNEIFSLRKTLNDAFRNLKNSGINTVLAIDNFDRMTKCINEGKKNDALENFKYLRNLHNNSSMKVRYIVTSKKSIEAISDECMASGFPGIFNNPIKLELLEDRDIKKYIFRRLSLYGFSISDYEDELITRAGGRVPGILEKSVDILLEYKKKSIELNSNYEEEFLQKVEERCDHIFKSCWKCITYEEQRLLKHLCCGEEISDVKEQILEVGRLSCKDMKLLNEDDTFVSEAFMHFVEKAEVIKTAKGSGTSEEDMEELYAILEEIKESVKKLRDSHNDEKKDMGEKQTTDINTSAMGFADKEEYNQYIISYFTNQFEKYGMDVDNCKLLKGMSVEKVWDRIDEDIRKQIIQAELLSHVYRGTGFDQSPSCNPFCTAFEAIINRKVLKPVIYAIKKLHPEFEITERSKDGYDENGLPKTLMIGQFRTILQNYYYYIKDHHSYKFRTDPILKIYDIKFSEKFKEISIIRNKCSHWEDVNGQKNELNVSDLDKLRTKMLGIGGTSCIEYMLKLADTCKSLN